MSLTRWISLCALALSCGSALAAPLDSRALDSIPLHVVPAAELERVLAAQPPEHDHGPLTLAISVPMSVEMVDGSWSENGAISTWRARVYSAGATVLIGTFDRFDLPEDAELSFSDAAGTVSQGPYTATQRGTDGTLVTAMIPGEEGLIEVRVPTARKDQVDLRLASLGHGVHDFHAGGVTAKSGGCNVDVECPEGAAWRSQVRSVVHLQIPQGMDLGGNRRFGLCTGQLVNNTANDVNRRFLLTANHCGANAGNASGIVVYFNYQTAICNGTRTERPAGFPNQTGTAFRATDSRSDHTLLELNQAPAASLNVYYSGFDATAGATPTNGACIHHPAGDEKRISLYSTASRVNGQPIGSFTVDAYRVEWDIGVTEGGSSGSGLWNQSGLLVGVLSGGASSCSSRENPDYFGRLDLAWTNGLRPFLDTARNGSTSVAGRNSSGGSSGGEPSSGSGSGSGSSGGGGAFGSALLLLCVGLGRLLYRVTLKR